MAEVQDISAIIRKVMEENHISPSEIPQEKPFEWNWFFNKRRHRKRWSKRYFRVYAKGKFECADSNCGHTWPSHCCWCIIDLKEQKIVRLFKQKCSKQKKKHLAEDPDYQGECPTYTDKSVRRLARWAVKLHLYATGKIDKPAKSTDHYIPTAKHRVRECEMCGLLKGPCYLPSKKPSAKH